MSASTSSPGTMRKKSTPATTPVAQSVSRLPGDRWPAPVLSARTIQSACSMRYQKEAL